MSTLTFLVLQYVGGKATLIPYIGGIFAIFLLDDILQVVVDLGTNTHGLLEAARPHGEDHELLHGQLVAGMGASIDDIESLRGSSKDQCNDSLGTTLMVHVYMSFFL